MLLLSSSPIFYVAFLSVCDFHFTRWTHDSSDFEEYSLLKSTRIPWTSFEVTSLYRQHHIRKDISTVKKESHTFVIFRDIKREEDKRENRYGIPEAKRNVNNLNHILPITIHIDKNISAKVCFHSNNDCCWLINDISVRYHFTTSIKDVRETQVIRDSESNSFWEDAASNSSRPKSNLWHLRSVKAGWILWSWISLENLRCCFSFRSQ